MYKVVMFNDDYTPMDFVVEVLEGIFNHSREQATKIMLAVHTEGQAVCGLYTRDVAETKAMQVNQYARNASTRCSVRSRRTVNSDCWRRGESYVEP